MGLKTFPKESLIPSQALVRSDRDGYDIRINLQPFMLDDESIKTAFCLDGVQLPEDKQAWVNQTFTFPVNPHDGYIDGSIYLLCVHNPADVTSIRFGEIHDNLISAEFSIYIDFEFEGTDFQNTNFVISVPLKIDDA
jgi:hypothetical protein